MKSLAFLLYRRRVVQGTYRRLVSQLDAVRDAIHSPEFAHAIDLSVPIARSPVYQLRRLAGKYDRIDRERLQCLRVISDINTKLATVAL